MKTIIITGVSRGMGKAYTEKFLLEGWYVIGTSTSGTIPIQHPHLDVYRLNLADQETIQKFTEQLSTSKKIINALINNAGVNLSSRGEFTQRTLSVAILRQTLEINLIGVISLTEALLPLVKKGGSIINVSSGAGSLTKFITSWVPSYAISKTAINMYTKTLADRLAEKDIIVSSFDPGWVSTDMGGPQAPKSPAQAAEEMYTLVTSKRPSGYFWFEEKKRPW